MNRGMELEIEKTADKKKLEEKYLVVLYKRMEKGWIKEEDTKLC